MFDHRFATTKQDIFGGRQEEEFLVRRLFGLKCRGAVVIEKGLSTSSTTTATFRMPTFRFGVVLGLSSPAAAATVVVLGVTFG